MRPLAGKVAVVTGSGQGIGRGIALMLASFGAKVITNDLKPRSTDEVDMKFRATALAGDAPLMSAEEETDYLVAQGDADTTAQAIVDLGGEAVALYADVTDHDAAGRLIHTAVDSFGHIDILVNNAAGLGFGPFVSLTPDDWKYQVSAKLDGTYNCMSHAVPLMVARGSGRILNASSDALTGIAMMAPYAAANAAVVALTKSVAKEVDRHGVTVNAFCPQAASPGHMSFNAAFKMMLARQGIEIKVDEDRMRRSEEAHGPAENLTMLAYLASDEASHINGAVFSVSGGGDIALYNELEHIAHIEKRGAPWTFSDLRSAVPARLLTGYRPIAERIEF
ncbi:SDR family oxidoreductase [Rhodococcus sp. WS1]|nr:SDR family oxidoreductase [Rhodococcus sp. WS1]TQC36102.1 SDR family oxidoreductase [Rhodococcus sp. WS7]